MGSWKMTTAAAAAAGGVALLALPVGADTGQGTSAGPITIPAAGTDGPSNPYPSTITLAGVAGTVESVEVTLDNFSHTFPSDLMILLQAPSGATTVLSAYCGGSSDVVDVDLVFVAGGTPLPDGLLTSGTFAPTECFPSGDLAAPAPAGPYGTGFGALFGGTPNGDWHLWIEDQAGADAGDLEGWSLRVNTNTAPVTTNGSASTTPGTPVSGSLASLTTDAEGDTLTYAVGTTPAHGSVTVDPATGAFTYTPTAGFVGTDSFTFTADDGVVAPTDPPPVTFPEEEQFEPAAVSAPATVTITVSAQATTSTTAATSTTARAALARTGVDRGATAGGGVLSIVLGLGLVGASGALVSRASRRRSA
jgi:subtilisin-like proprotein convertase family protein